MDALIPILVLLIIIGGVVWWRTHCPECYRPLAKRIISKEKRSVMQHLTGKQTRTYECRHCGHQWTKTIYIDA